jgi:hypothetical protein
MYPTVHATSAAGYVKARPVSSSSPTSSTGLLQINRIWSVVQQGVQNLCPGAQIIGQPRHIGRAVTFCVDTSRQPIGANQIQALAEYTRFKARVPFVRLAERGDGTTLIELPAPVMRTILLDGNRALREGGHILLGPTLSDYGNAELNLDESQHVLIVANATERMMIFRTIVYQLARQNRPSQLRFVPFNRASALSEAMLHLAHMLCFPIGADTFEERVTFEEAVREIQKRERGSPPAPKLILLITDGDHWLAKNSFALSQLLERGGSVGIHVILAVSSVNATTLNNAIAKQFTTRLVGQMNSASDSDLASGVPNLECHWQLGDGDILFTPTRKRFQCPVVSEAAFKSLPQAAHLTKFWS